MLQPSSDTSLPYEQYVSMSYDDFLVYADDIHAEWIEEQIIVFMPPNTIHQQIVGFLHILIGLYVQMHGLGQLLSAPFEMRAHPGGSAREPDLLFVAREHLGYLTPERLDGAADLVIEIVSESSVVRDRVDKFYEYQTAGVREYWIIDPRVGKERVDLYWLTPEDRYQAIVPDSTGRFNSVVLDGFWLRSEWLWQVPRLDPLMVLSEIAPGVLRTALENDQKQQPGN